MRCKMCGGEIDLSLRECSRCGQRLPEDYTPLMRSMEELAKDYGMTEDEGPTALPDLFREYEDVRTHRSQVLLGKESSSEKKVRGAPALGREEYVRLLGVEDLSEITKAEPAEALASEPSDPEAVLQSENQAEIQQKDQPRSSSEADDYELHPILQKIDKLIEKPADRVLEYYHAKHPQPTRVRKSPATERLMLLAATVGAVVVLAVLTIIIISSIAPDISGEWLVSETTAGERLTIEFTDSGKVTARIYIEDDENVYLTGTYKVRRSNGSNLLTITYDDGSERRLYYTIENDAGIFTNVDSSKSDTYIRID